MSTIVTPVMVKTMATTGSAALGPQPNTVHGTGDGWVWAYATLIGTHHQCSGGVCEDAAGVKLLNGAASSRVHLALADGVSGGARGDVASKALVEHCLNWQPTGRVSLRDWMAQEAEISVQRALRQLTDAPGAATLVAAWFDTDGNGIVNRVGDCRAYLWHPEECGQGIAIRQLMPDQTLGYMGYVGAQDWRARQPAHMVGNQSTGEPEFVNISVPAEGGLVLCSDGAHEVIDTDCLASNLGSLSQLENAESRDKLLATLCGNVVQCAQHLGSEDDIALLVLWRVLT